ncbi:nucleic acid binding protein [Elderberry carlavirus D]|uniref:RNA silencing suppressor n=1 Tax=Elderberry carlavirus D TaxID=1569055 RepID=A0A0A7M9D1_9VIRU|nr:nucleic acid binding protein [Elderberry carlavirus D]AIZ76636.1 nucleic acid binding protein [Elderberry carlavirus D]
MAGEHVQINPVVRALAEAFEVHCSTNNNYNYYSLCKRIVGLNKEVGTGRSNMAKRRRAAALGRSPRCGRVAPGFYFTTKCNGRTCFDAFGRRSELLRYIKFGQRKETDAPNDDANRPM